MGPAATVAAVALRDGLTKATVGGVGGVEKRLFWAVRSRTKARRGRQPSAGRIIRYGQAGLGQG